MDTKNKIVPRISLVGAGPGDPELITLKAVNAIAEADVILYDALVNIDLLKYAPQRAKKIFVGKKAANHAYSQQEINQMIVGYALSYGHVVRLKGGDPFVFGRGHEELTFAEVFNIKVNVIPGISSAIAVPELQHIPLTKRGVSESFWVITATTSNGELSEDIYKAAQSDATVVILMGVSKLKEITEIFIKAGKNNTAAAVIESGSLPGEKIGIATVDNIVDVVKNKNLGSPAVIIIGDVVKLHPEAELVFNYELINRNY
ncbi:MAG: uroporphyrinogen-III C-methyltransferase [Ignavibacteriaceae bacterium]